MANRRRNKQINFRCTETEFEEISEKIALSQKSNTDFLLETLQGKEMIVIPGLLEVLAELKQEGINLNQALRYAHAERKFLPQLKTAICNCNALYQRYLILWQERCR